MKMEHVQKRTILILWGMKQDRTKIKGRISLASAVYQAAFCYLRQVKRMAVLALKTSWDALFAPRQRRQDAAWWTRDWCGSKMAARACQSKGLAELCFSWRFRGDIYKNGKLHRSSYRKCTCWRMGMVSLLKIPNSFEIEFKAKERSKSPPRPAIIPRPTNRLLRKLRRVATDQARFTL